MHMESNSFDGITDTSPVVLSWGRRDLGTLLAGSEPIDGVFRYDSKFRTVRQIASSSYHTACLTSTGEIIMCGSNDEGQIAADETQSTSELAAKRPRINEALSNSHRMVSVACGLYHTLCLTSTGTVIAFGLNDVGQCGHDFSRSSSKYSKVDFKYRGKSPLVVKQICCGDMFSLFLTTTGEVYACGLGSNLGNGQDSNSAVAERVEALVGANIISIAAGSSYSFALSATGELYAWGSNQHGQLGLGHLLTESVLMPTSVQLPPDIGRVVGISAGYSHSIIWTSTGIILGCGSNKYGQVGITAQPRLYSFEKIPLKQQVQMAACGQNHTIVLALENSTKSSQAPEIIFGFGSNSFGQVLGSSTMSMFRDPVEIKNVAADWSLERILYIAAGGDQSFAIGMQSAELTSEALMRKQFSTQASSSTSAMSTESFIRMIDEASKHPRKLNSTLFTVCDLFSSPSLLAGSFLANGTIDCIGVESCYAALFQLGSAAVVRLSGALQAALTDLHQIMESHSSSSNGQAGASSPPEAIIHTLLVLWMCPIHANSAMSVDLFPRLAELVNRLPPHLAQKLYDTAATFPPHLFAPRIVKPLQEHISVAIEAAVTTGGSFGDVLPGLCSVLRELHTVNQSASPHLVPPEVFFNAAVGALPDRLLHHDFLAWQQHQLRSAQGSNAQLAAVPRTSSPFFFSGHSFLMSADTKRRMLLADAAAQQHQAQQNSALQGLFGGAVGGYAPWLIVQVARDQLLQHAITCISAASDLDLKKPMKVLFHGEEGIDEGGVKKEFFQLLVAQLFSPDYGMFLPTADGRTMWVNKSSVEMMEAEFKFVGVLLGLAVYNGVLLDIKFPVFFFKKLLGLNVTMDDVAGLDPELHRGLGQLLEYSPAEEVEHVFCRNFVVEWDSFGQQRTAELLPGGADIAVTGENRQLYVDKYVDWLLNTSVAEPFRQLYEGFTRVVHPGSLKLLTEADLELLMVGQPHLDFKELERHAEYVGESDWGPSHPTVQGFWEVVHSLELEEKQKLLLFVTGSKKAPIGGLRNLGLKIQRMGPDCNLLPTAHTCFNTLLLPEYSTQAKTRERLLKAISECEGFGLK